MEKKIYAVFDKTVNYDDQEVKDIMVCVCKTKELAQQVCAMKPNRWFMESSVKLPQISCQHYRNDDGCSWCEKNFWVISNKNNTDCERKCKERYEI